MPDLHSVQWQLQFILCSYVCSGGGAEKPAHGTVSTSYATTPSSMCDFIPYSQPQADTVAATCIPGPGDKIFPTVTVWVIMLIPLQSSWHTSRTLGCWWLGRHLLSLTVLVITTWYMATKETSLWHMRSQRKASESCSAFKSHGSKSMSGCYTPLQSVGSLTDCN